MDLQKKALKLGAGVLIIGFFALTPKAFADFQLDVSIVNNNLRINSCSSQLQANMGYKGYIDDVEIFTTGQSGGFPCFNGDLFISNLTSFVSGYPVPLTLSFDFYSSADFNPPIFAHFDIYYDGSEFSIPDESTTIIGPLGDVLTDGQNTTNGGGILHDVTIQSAATFPACTYLNGSLNGVAVVSANAPTGIVDVIAGESGRMGQFIKDGYWEIYGPGSGLSCATEDHILRASFYITSGFIATCSDGIQNQDETGVDVGGVCGEAVPPTPALHTPVLIVPGVLGTEINKGTEKLWLDLLRHLTDFGDQFLDPLQFNIDLTPLDTSLTIGDVIRKVVTFDYADSLIKEFESQNYIEDTDLFLFPYDWRYGISENNINELKQKIEDIKTETGNSEIDVIAHSTGGLLVKKYVMDNPDDNYINKAIFVGVPNTGAPKAIKALLQGDSFGVPLLADDEIKKIAKNLPIVYDLSPSQQYFDIKGSYVKIIDQGFFTSSSQDLDFGQTNLFLTDDHSLNGQALSNAHNLHTTNFDNFDMRDNGVELYSINGCKAGTISKIIERRSQHLFGTSVTYDIPERSPGDGTVPLESATNLPIDQENKYYSLKTDHGKMLSQEEIRQQIVNLITGSSLNIGSDLVTQDISECELNGKAIAVFSPLDISITDQDGNYSGLIAGGIQNDIPNASFEIMGEHKFVYLPDDEGQTYTINIEGTGDGTFTIKEQNINDNVVTQTQIFSNIPVTTSLAGEINLDTVTTLTLDNNGDGTIDETIQPSATVNSDQSQDLIPPTSASIITGTAGQPNFYRSNVTINISATDPVIPGEENQTSGILKTIYKLDNDSSYTTYINPIEVSSEEPHTLKFFSTDNAGNNETEQFVEFTVDKTPPELQLTFNTTTKDVVLFAKDLIDPNPTIATTSNSITLTDASGNTTIIPFTRLKELPTRLRLSYDKIIRNGVITTLSNTNIVYDWQEKNGILTDLDTKVTIKSEERYVFNYKKANNVTIIREEKSSGIVTATKPGFVVVNVKTEGDGLGVDY